MSAVPFTFANASGAVPASELDVNFANVKAAADTAGIVTTNAQPNITSVGTLTALSVTGNIIGVNLLTVGRVTATGNISGGQIYAVDGVVFNSKTITTGFTLNGFNAESVGPIDLDTGVEIDIVDGDWLIS